MNEIDDNTPEENITASIDNKEDSEYFDDILESVLSRRRNSKVSGMCIKSRYLHLSWII